MSGIELLREYQRSTKATQTQLAARFGITAAYVSMLLSGERVVTGLRVADRIERATGGLVPASSWLHDLSKRTARASRKPPVKARVVRRRASRSANQSPHR